MTTNWVAVRQVAVPAVLLAAGTVFLLTNDTTSSQAARSAAGGVADWPTWAQWAVAGASEGGLVLLAVLLGAAAWQARSLGPDRVATAMVGGLGVVVALAASELMKALVAQERPCRAVPELDAVAECPPIGDWSLPSNHATLAAALATALVWSAPRRWLLAAPLVLVVAASRVGLGVHYPHDVVDGLVVGVVVVSLLVMLLRRLATRASQRFLLDVIRFSQPLGSKSDGPAPEPGDAESGNEVFAEDMAEMGRAEPEQFDDY